MIWSYNSLNQFKNSLLGNLVISSSDLIKERMLNYKDKEYHVWIAKKDKREYLILNDNIKKLPIRIKSTQKIVEGNSIYHFVNRHNSISFAPEKHVDFRQLVNDFFNVEHSNRKHHLLLKIIALASYCHRINIRICSSMEFLKDGTFEVLNYLTNTISVFDKPRTMAKLEFGIVNKVLVVNELVPKSEDERRAITDFLLSIGSLKPIYQKTTRGSEAHKTKDTYDISELSLIICYNTLNDLNEEDKKHYFDYVFSPNICSRFMPFKFSGKTDIEQFTKDYKITMLDIAFFRKMAQTMAWYKINWRSELKPFYIDLKELNLPERYKYSLYIISQFINLYALDKQEFDDLVNELMQCHYSYQRMLAGNTLLLNEQKPEVKEYKEDVVLLNNDVEEVHEGQVASLRELTHLSPALQYLKDRNGECSVAEFMEKYTENDLRQLEAKAEVFMPRPNLIKVLE